MPNNLSVPDRWWQKVDRRGDDECWPWTASRDRDGYGRFQEPTPHGQRHTRAHIWIMEHIHGPIPAGRIVMHSCDNPWCVNPVHLSIATPFDNNADKVAKGRHAVPWGTALSRSRQTHCHRGHPFDEANTYIDPNGHRQCRTCNRINERRYYHARKAS